MNYLKKIIALIILCVFFYFAFIIIRLIIISNITGYKITDEISRVEYFFLFKDSVKNNITLNSAYRNWNDDQIVNLNYKGEYQFVICDFNKYFDESFPQFDIKYNSKIDFGSDNIDTQIDLQEVVLHFHSKLLSSKPTSIYFDIDADVENKKTGKNFLFYKLATSKIGFGNNECNFNYYFNLNDNSRPFNFLLLTYRERFYIILMFSLLNTDIQPNSLFQIVNLRS